MEASLPSSDHADDRVKLELADDALGALLGWLSWACILASWLVLAVALIIGGVTGDLDLGVVAVAGMVALLALALLFGRLAWRGVTAALAARRDPGAVVIAGDRLIIEHPATLTEPLQIHRSWVASVQDTMPRMGLTARGITRLTLSMRKPTLLLELHQELPIPRAKNVPPFPRVPQQLPSTRRDATALVFRFADPDEAAALVRRWFESAPAAQAKRAPHRPSWL
jgi:hypothetical protein